MGSARRTVWTAAALAGLLVVLPLTGCVRWAPQEEVAPPAQASGFPLFVTDDASRRVLMDAPAERIVSLAPANSEIVASLGLIDHLVGVTTYDDYPPAVKKIAKVGDFTTPNLEAIAKADPDLVLVTGGVQADVIEKLEGLDATVLVIDPKSIGGVKVAVRNVAEACGVPDKATTVIHDMDAHLDRVAAAIADRDVVPCFIEIGYDPLFTAGGETLVDEMMRLAGGSNVVKEEGYVSYSVERLIADQPAFYLGTSSSLVDPASIGTRPGYAQLTAVSSGKVAVLADNLVSRPGPRVAEGVEEMARALHPDAF